MTHLIKWLIASLIALVLSSAYLLDGSSDIDAMRASAASADDAQQAANISIRFANAASKVCGGENSAWMRLDATTVQCYTKRGYKTVIANVIVDGSNDAIEIKATHASITGARCQKDYKTIVAAVQP
ncbi:MAG TPA: hypothetical protein VIK56_15625 [Rhodoferax sp.]